MKQLQTRGVTADDARNAVQALKKDLSGAALEENEAVRQSRKAIAVDTFRFTPFGTLSRDWILRRGFALVPLFPGDGLTDMESMCQEMLRCGLVTEEIDGGVPKLSVPNLKWGCVRGNDRRYMVDPHDRLLRKKSDTWGKGFVDPMQEMAATMACALQGLSYGELNDVDIEKLTLLISPPGMGVQVCFFLVVVVVEKIKSLAIGNSTHLL